MVATPGVQSTDVVPSDFVDAAELVSDGTSIFLTTTVSSTTNATSTVVIALASDGEGILYSKDHPVLPGNIAVISGSSGADGTYHVSTVPTNTSFTTVESILTSTGGSVNFQYQAGSTRVGFDPTKQNVTSSNVVEQVATDIANHELLDNEPVSTGVTYSATRSGNQVTHETWTNTVTTKTIKTIVYSYSGGKVTQEVRTVYATDGITIIAEVTLMYTYTGSTVTGETITRNV